LRGSSISGASAFAGNDRLFCSKASFILPAH
jgi:hypothetical protein